MTRLEFINNLLPIIYPKFLILKNSVHQELVFLDNGNEYPRYIDDSGIAVGDFIGDDKTQCEATNNHFHLFQKVSETNREYAKKIGKAIAINLFRTLSDAYPDKRFVVYLEVNTKGSTIIRFHQIWDNEPPYFDVTEHYQDGLELFEFGLEAMGAVHFSHGDG